MARRGWKLDFCAGISKIVEFTDEKPLTAFMSTSKWGKASGAALHKGVEICVEVVEAVRGKGLPEKGSAEPEREGPVFVPLKFLRFHKRNYGGGRKEGRSGI